MEKLKDFSFTYEFWVPFDDADMGWVVHNSKYLLYFERCRTRYFKHAGVQLFPPQDNLSFLVKKHEIEYLAPATFDDILVCGSSIYYIGRSSFRFKYLIVRKSDEREIVKGMTVVVNILPGEYKPHPLPKSFVDKIVKIEGEGILKYKG